MKILSDRRLNFNVYENTFIGVFLNRFAYMISFLNDDLYCIPGICLSIN